MKTKLGDHLVWADCGFDSQVRYPILDANGKQTDGRNVHVESNGTVYFAE